MGSPGDPRKKEEREEREKRRKRKERKAREREEIVARKSEARHTTYCTSGNRHCLPPLAAASHTQLLPSLVR